MGRDFPEVGEERQKRLFSPTLEGEKGSSEELPVLKRGSPRRGMC